MKTSSKPTSQNASGPQSVGRVFAILDFLVDHREGAGLAEFAAFAQAPKTSLVGLLNAMIKEGILSREASGRYVVGSRIIGFAMRAVAGRELPELARPFLLDLVANTGETAVLGVLAQDAEMVVYLDRVESFNPIRYAVTVGERRELHCTALGKVLLAHMPQERLERFLATQPLTRFTKDTITDPDVLRAELRSIREQGLALTNGERVHDARGLAAPVFTSGGEIAAGLLIAGPARRMEANQDANERHVRKAAAALTEVLGGRPRAASR